MALVKTFRVTILDQEYLIKSEEDEEQVHRVAEYVNEKLKEIRENAQDLSERKMAILAALNIASEFFQLLKERDVQSSDIRERARTLIYQIDSMMG